jgi:hypothetical protein
MHISFEAEMPFLGPVTAFVEGDFQVLFDHVNDSWHIGRICLDAPEECEDRNIYAVPEDIPEHKWLLEYLTDNYADDVEEALREEEEAGPEHDQGPPSKIAQFCL